MGKGHKETSGPKVRLRLALWQMVRPDDVQAALSSLPPSLLRC